MKISWIYLGPFFDGEGSVGLYIFDYRGRRKNGELKVVPSIQITCFVKSHVLNLFHFLKGEDISSCIRRIKRKVVGIAVRGWEDVLKFIDKIQSFTIIKRKELMLLKRACTIYNGLPLSKYNGKKIKENYKKFIPIARELHNLKGGKGRYNRKSFSYV